MTRENFGLEYVKRRPRTSDALRRVYLLMTRENFGPEYVKRRPRTSDALRRVYLLMMRKFVTALQVSHISLDKSVVFLYLNEYLLYVSVCESLTFIGKLPFYAPRLLLSCELLARSLVFDHLIEYRFP
jgi:hypothetical protein